MSNLATLQHQRADLSAEVTRLGNILVRLQSLKGEADDAQGKLAAFDSASASAMLAWAQDGAVGDAPEPDALERLTLSRSAARAQSAFLAASGAHASIAEQQREASATLSVIGGRIEGHALDTMRTEQAALVDDFHAFVEREVRPRLAKLMALHPFITDQARSHQAAGRTDAATALFQRAEALVNGSKALGDGNPTTGEVVAETRHWRARYAALTGNTAPVAPVVDVEARRTEAEAHARQFGRANREHVDAVPPPYAPNGPTRTHGAPLSPSHQGPNP